MGPDEPRTARDEDVHYDPTVRAALLLIVLCCTSCTPSSVSDAEKKRDVPWLVQHASPESISALGRLADQDQGARDALDKLSNDTVGNKTLSGGASALDVYLAAWGGVERKAPWGTAMVQRGLAERDRMNDAASAIKRGSPELETFMPALDRALLVGCDVRCGSALASAKSPNTAKVVASRLADVRTREAMCDGIGSEESSKEARAVFMRVPDSSRDALGCPGAAARLAAHDDEVLGWLARTAEPGLLRATPSDVLPCDRLAKLWSITLSARDHSQYSALVVPLGGGIRRCPKALDGMLAASLASDMDSQALAAAAIDPSDRSITDLPLACAALSTVARSNASTQTKSRAQDALAKCAKP